MERVCQVFFKNIDIYLIVQAILALKKSFEARALSLISYQELVK